MHVCVGMWVGGWGGGSFLSGEALGSCSSFLDAGSTKGLALLCLSFYSEAFGLGAFYEETTRELNARRAELVARTPETAGEPAEDTSGSLRWLSSLTGRSPGWPQLGQGLCPQLAACYTWLMLSSGTTWFGSLSFFSIPKKAL